MKNFELFKLAKRLKGIVEDYENQGEHFELNKEDIEYIQKAAEFIDSLRNK